MFDLPKYPFKSILWAFIFSYPKPQFGVEVILKKALRRSFFTMQKMAQEWFSQTVSSVDDSQKPSSSSLLANWNSYAASLSTDESSSLGLGFDLESAVCSANDTVPAPLACADHHDALMCCARELLGELQVQVSRALVATRNPTVL